MLRPAEASTNQKSPQSAAVAELASPISHEQEGVGHREGAWGPLILILAAAAAARVLQQLQLPWQRQAYRVMKHGAKLSWRWQYPAVWLNAAWGMLDKAGATMLNCIYSTSVSRSFKLFTLLLTLSLTLAHKKYGNESWLADAKWPIQPLQA